MCDRCDGSGLEPDPQQLRQRIRDLSIGMFEAARILLASANTTEAVAAIWESLSEMDRERLVRLTHRAYDPRSRSIVRR